MRKGTNEKDEAMTRIADLKKKLMSDPKFREEYEKADAEFQLIEALIQARSRANLTQAELARRIGTTQSAVARLEGGGVSPSLSTLRRYAEATGARLEINLVSH
ncbi:MAG: helix-turn-helix domain-containing protein [Shinella sp.]|jgi:DNA-binding XRE family transcriptional regulator|nr:helix-turn-helix domain-containing protein [Shinella sp.]